MPFGFDLPTNPKFGLLSPEQQVDILTALRGPDFDDGLPAKQAYTTPIRCWFFDCSPDRLHQLGFSYGDPAPVTVNDWDLLRRDSARKCENLGDGGRRHFYEHICRAAKAICRAERLAKEIK